MTIVLFHISVDNKTYFHQKLHDFFFDNFHLKIWKKYNFIF